MHYSDVAWRGHVPKRSLRKAQHDEVVGFLALVVGVVLFVAPWIAGEPDTARDAHVNEAVMGVVVVYTAARRVFRGGGWFSDVVLLAVGAWLIASPWVLAWGDTVVRESRTIDVALGSVLVALALVSLALLAGSRRRGGTGEVVPEGGHRRR
ncbi:SPW repeat domain-containing protein [Streptomyces sp. 4N509B]|uniref:SPW repeat domain-containing protein n=1 Tax=Streptomyces sp. 4N509B TaxID=3457413 RepID=UPI003FD65AD4